MKPIKVSMDNQGNTRTGSGNESTKGAGCDPLGQKADLFACHRTSPGAPGSWGPGSWGAGGQ